MPRYVPMWVAEMVSQKGEGGVAVAVAENLA